MKKECAPALSGRRRSLGVALVLGLGHCSVDLASHFGMARLARWMDPLDIVGFFVAFNFFELGIQPLFGLLEDRLRRPRLMALTGLGMLTMSLFLPERDLWLSIVVNAVGNTLFHIGAGVIAMRATPFSASGPGLFIAPGAIGVAIGRTWGSELAFPLWPAAALLLVPAAALIATRAMELPREPSPDLAPSPTRQWFSPVALLLVAIALRAFVGLRVTSALSANGGWALFLAAAVFLGKAGGGFAADWAGWRPTAVGLLAASALLFPLADLALPLALLSLLLFQGVTAVTLAAIWKLLPTRPGLSFGLNCTALFLGAVPVVVRQPLVPPYGLDAGLAIVAAIAIWFSFSHLQRSTRGAELVAP